MKELIDTTFTTVTENEEQVRVPDLGGVETDSDVQYSVMDKGNGDCLVRATFPAGKYDDVVSAGTVLSDEEADMVIKAHHPRSGLENLDQPDVEVDELLDEHDVTEVLDAEEQMQLRVVYNWRDDLDADDRSRVLAQNRVDDPRLLVDKLDKAELAEVISEYEIGNIPDHIPTSTAARAVVQVQSKGRQVLQDQEMTAMMKVARAKSRKDADKMSKNTRADNDGKMNSHCECVLDGKNKEHQEFLEYCKGERTDPPVPDGENPHAKGTPGN